MIKFKLSFSEQTDNFWILLQDEFRSNNFTIEEVKQSLDIVKKCFVYNKPTLSHFLNYKEIYISEYNKIKYEYEIINVDEYLCRINETQNKHTEQNSKLVRLYFYVVDLILKYHMTEKLFMSYNDFLFVNKTFSFHRLNLKRIREAFSSYEVRSNKSLELGLIAWAVKHSESLD